MAIPLSDVISHLIGNPTEEAFESFLEAFLSATVGVVAENMPADRRPGERFAVGPNDRIRMQPVITADGRRMIKARADPAVFARRYPDVKITSLIEARELVRTLPSTQEIDGILVCSAASFHSVPISQSDAERLRAKLSRAEPSARPWWKIWGE